MPRAARRPAARTTGATRRRSATSPTGSTRSPSTTTPRTATSKPTSCSRAVNWQIGDLTLSTNTSFIEYDKEDWLDPDDSSFAVFNDHRLEDFDQFAQEIRLTSPLDQAVSWMVGAYFQEHTLHSRIDVFLPRLLGTAAYQPAGRARRRLRRPADRRLGVDERVLRGDVERDRHVPRELRRPLSGRDEGRSVAGRGGVSRRPDGDELRSVRADSAGQQRRRAGRRHRRSQRVSARGRRRVGHLRQRHGVRQVRRSVQERRLRDVAARRRRLAEPVQLRARVRRRLRDRHEEPPRRQPSGAQCRRRTRPTTRTCR